VAKDWDIHSTWPGADGQLLASGGLDGTIRLWETPTGQLVSTLQGHTGGVRSVALSADGWVLASGGDDGTVRLWDPRVARSAGQAASSGACLRTLRSDRRYARVDITGLTGVTVAQRAALLALGAVDRQDPAASETPAGVHLATREAWAPRLRRQPRRCASAFLARLAVNLAVKQQDGHPKLERPF
jgi:hypothetical protein